MMTSWVPQIITNYMCAATLCCVTSLAHSLLSSHCPWVAVTVISSDHYYGCRHCHLSCESLTDTKPSGPLVFHRRHARYRGPGLGRASEGRASLPQNNLVACSCAEGRWLVCMSQWNSTNQGRSKNTYLTANPLCDGVSSSSFRNIPENQKEALLWVIFPLRNGTCPIWSTCFMSGPKWLPLSLSC